MREDTRASAARQFSCARLTQTWRNISTAHENHLFGVARANALAPAPRARPTTAKHLDRARESSFSSHSRSVPKFAARDMKRCDSRVKGRGKEIRLRHLAASDPRVRRMVSPSFSGANHANLSESDRATYCLHRRI